MLLLKFQVEHPPISLKGKIHRCVPKVAVLLVRLYIINIAIIPFSTSKNHPCFFMYSKTILFSIFFALAAVAEPQRNFHLHFFKKNMF